MSQEEKLEMEDIVKEEKCRRSRESEAARGVPAAGDGDDGAEARQELGTLRAAVAGRVAELGARQQQDTRQWEGRLRGERAELVTSHAHQLASLQQRQEEARSALAARHKQQEVELVAEQTKEVFR